MQKKHFEHVNQILDFYKNQKLNSGFDNSFFKEDNSEKWVLPRLERAAKDEADGQVVHSRYAIWASSVNELIINSMQAIKNQDSAGAIRQLEVASNAIKAYRDIRTIFDDENFYKISEVFEAYASYLLNIDDRDSEIIDRNGIIKRLKEYSKASGVGLPRDIGFSIKNGVLKVLINNVTQNMQVDSAAFEGWILALKAWLSDEVKYVELDFVVPTDVSRQYGNSEACHYNRLLYRLNNMLRMFPNWFFLHESKMEIVFNFMRWLDSSTCLLNHSLQERKSVIETDKLERQIESWFVFEEGKDLLCNRWSISKDKIFNQLPIGVFFEKIASKNAILTRGASAIDLWGIGNDEQTLHLIELKCGGNKGMGVISEMLFYAAVIYDTCIREKSLFSFGKYGKAPDTKDMVAIKNGGNKFKRLFTHILAEKYHPLFDVGVEALICAGLSNMDIDFDKAEYDYSKKVLIDESRA